MPVPKRKHSKQRTRIKRNEKLQQSAVNTQVCQQCGAQKLPHRVCAECGSEK